MEKILRSFIHEHFSIDLRVKIELLSRRRDLVKKEEKQHELIQLLQNNDINNLVKLGSGTNRYAFRLDGFVVKVATDNDGKIDNMKEFKMAKRLYPYVSKTYEVSENGTLLIAEYIPPFSSYSEMLKYADVIRSILKKLSDVYLIGDVGITEKNYSNWGIRIGTDDPVCLDFAYVYEVSSKYFICRNCKNNAMLVPDNDFTKLKCSAKGCGKYTTFSDVRALIGNDIHRHEIGDLTEEGYKMRESGVLVNLTPERSNYLTNKNKSDESDNKIEENEETSSTENIVDDEYSFEDINENINKEDDDMTTVKAKEIAKGIVDNYGPYTPGRVIFSAKSVTVVNNDEKEKGDTKETYNNSLAFSCEIIDDEDTDINDIKKPTVKNVVPSVIDNTSKPNKQPAVTKPNTISHERSSKFSDKFIGELHKALSKFSNIIKYRLRNEDLIKYMSDITIDDPNVFYDGLGKSLFSSLLDFFDFKREFEKNPDGKGSIKKFIPPETIDGREFIDSLVFIERLWNIADINQSEDIMLKYTTMFKDCHGMQREWLRILEDRLLRKMKLSEENTDMVISKVGGYWCVPLTLGSFNSLIDDLSVDEDDVDDEMIDIINDEIIDDDNPDEERDDYYHDQEEYEDDQEDEEYDDEDYEDYLAITISIIMDEDGFDIVHLVSGEPYGNVTIPFYVRMDDININQTVPSIVDDRNGIWDWLIHLTPLPDGIFRTKNPEKYLEHFNEIDENDPEHNYRVAILDNVDDYYIMGLFDVAGIYVVDENNKTYATCSKDIIAKLNKIIKDNVGYGQISHLAVSLSNSDLIKSEDSIFKYIDDDDEEDEDNEEMIGDEVVDYSDESDIEIDEDNDIQEIKDPDKEIIKPIRRIDVEREIAEMERGK